MADQDFTLSIDVGTGSVRAALVDYSGRIRAIAAEEQAQIVPAFGWAEQSVEGWWSGVVRAIGRVLAEEPNAAQQISAICACGQMHGTVLIDDDGRPTRENAPLWIVEVSDFQCPFCRNWHAQTYPAVMKEFVESGKVRLAYINFPIPGHKNAWPAAEAAMCAAAQGRFWPMHDELFDSQQTWEGLADPSSVFDSLATKAGVDLGQYHDCVSQHKMRALIQADIDRLFQGPVADALTHTGQIAMLRRLAGFRKLDEDFYRAEIAVGQTGADQPAPVMQY